MSSSPYQIGQKVLYLYKLNGEQFTVEATIISLNGSQIDIEFRHPATRHVPRGYLHRRVLKTAKDRARLVGYEVPRRGASLGNQHAKKNGPCRILTTLSFADTRLEKVAKQLQRQGKEVNRSTLKTLAYEAIDAYLCLDKQCSKGEE